MPSVASQVEVQAPPGLEFRAWTHPDEAEPALSSEATLHETLVKEVTASVQQHIDAKTASAVEALWQKGQRAMQYMAAQHASQTEKLQSQLAACAESYRNLERENTILRKNLEALMVHITMVVESPHFAGAPGSPFFPWAAAKTQPAPEESPKEFFAAPLPDTPRRDLLPSTSTVVLSEESLKPELETVDKASDVAVPRQDWVTITRPNPQSVDKDTVRFKITLRRADTVPLGLDVIGETGGECLTVQAVRQGGAVEAWNRQCPGELREIRTGDMIIAINDVEDANAMREECLTKHLLKMTVVRQVSPPNTTATTQTAASPFLRADANEFVPLALPTASS